VADVVIITGATGGLGAALVRAFADAKVAIHGRANAERAAQLAATNQSSCVLIGDLAGADRDTQAARMVEQVCAELGPPTVLVNAAADQSLGDWREQSSAETDAIIAGTFGSMVAMTRAVSAVMPQHSAIVNIASVEALQPFPRHAHYAAAKAAMVSFTRSAACDLGPLGIRVNAVLPGLIDRPGLATDWPEGYRAWCQQAALRRPVSADEVASATHFLATAPGITGAALLVDAGWSVNQKG
jgi:NAD(P)-dependent dehydrogenase (short-subunit alcohol dehydrogenase family)